MLLCYPSSHAPESTHFPFPHRISTYTLSPHLGGGGGDGVAALTLAHTRRQITHGYAKSGGASYTHRAHARTSSAAPTTQKSHTLNLVQLMKHDFPFTHKCTHTPIKSSGAPPANNGRARAQLRCACSTANGAQQTTTRDHHRRQRYSFNSERQLTGHTRSTDGLYWSRAYTVQWRSRPPPPRINQNQLSVWYLR